MKKLNKIEAVTERDIDLLLLEEMNVSEPFCRWLASTASMPITAVDSHAAWHSISAASLGESDLLLLIESGGQTYALLIEDKIDAPAMPEQGGRYQLRGQVGLQEGEWHWFATCMIAPALYLQKSGDAGSYDYNLSYESIVRWLEDNCDEAARARWKIYLLREAIEQNRRGWVMRPDDNATAFWQAYWEIVSERHPELQMRQPSAKPANSDWIYFYPDVIPKGWCIVHKLRKGCVDLRIRGAADQLEKLADKVVGHEVVVVRAGKSAAVRVTVPSTDKFQPFQDQYERVVAGMEAASRLLEVGHKLVTNA